MVEPVNTPPVGEQRRPGMDQQHHAYRTLTEAPRFAWPDGARIAFTVTLVLDYGEVNPPKDANADPRVVSPLGKFFPDWLTWSQREYGARVGIFRVLDVLDRFGVTPSVALGSAAAKRYPELVDELMRHATQKKYEYRHQWRPGDWLLWDNRSVMHQANPDYDMRERRYLYRLMLKGEVPA